MSELYQRRWRVEVERLIPGTGATDTREALRVDALRVLFSVKKTLEKEPNTADVTIVNLGEDSRRKVELSRGGVVRLTAGYEGNEALIFSGNVRFASSAREGADWRTKIESGDGELAFSSAKFNATFSKNANARDVIKAAAAALGVGKGNLDKMIDSLPNPTHVRGFAASGRASDVLGQLLKSQGLNYSIQGGQLQVLKKGEPVEARAILLSANTGLIGSPEVSAPKEVGGKPTIKVKAYLQPQIRCGGLVEVRSNALRGQYLVTSLEHSGDSAGAQWYTSIEVTQR